MALTTSFRNNVVSFFGHLAFTSLANYLVLATAARQLDANNLAHFVTLAAFVNGATLAILIPLEQVAPRWIRDGHSARSIVLRAASLGIPAALTALFLNSILSDQSFLISDTIYAFGALAFNITRSTLVGTGNLKRLSIYSLAYFGYILIGLSALSFGNLWSIQNLAITVGCVGLAASAPHLFKSLSELPRVNLAPPKQLHLVFSGLGRNLAGLLFLYGPLLVAAFRNLPDTEVVLYVALSNLARFLLYPLQALIPALTDRVYEMRDQRQYSLLISLHRQTTSVLLLGIPFLVGAFAFSGSTLASFTLGSPYGVSSAFAALIALTEVLGILSTIPLLISLAFGHSRLLLGSSAVGVLVFLIVSLLPWDSTALLVFCRLAPISLIGVAVNVSVLRTLISHSRSEST